MRTAADDVRREVEQAYSERVTRPNDGGLAKGAVAELAGYTPEELAGLPTDAVENSFGCGNPVHMSDLQPGDVVLDLGCGAGIDLLLAAERVGPTGRVIGVDMSEAMLAKAAENARLAGAANVEVRRGIIEELPVEDGSVDWVISNCVINLSPEKPRVFREIARVLKPGGRMLVSDIVARDLPTELLAVPGLRASCVAGAIDEESYIAGLNEAGLVDVEVRARLVYDAEQIAVAAVEAVGVEAVSGCGCVPADARAAITREVARRLQGSIWSGKFYGRKPEGRV